MCIKKLTHFITILIKLAILKTEKKYYGKKLLQINIPPSERKRVMNVRVERTKNGLKCKLEPIGIQLLDIFYY